jgi:hypothetical protein
LTEASVIDIKGKMREVMIERSKRDVNPVGSAGKQGIKSEWLVAKQGK